MSPPENLIVMKMLCIILAVIALIPCMSLAQNDPHRPDSIVTYEFIGADSSVVSREAYEYNPHGWLLRMLSYKQEYTELLWVYDIYRCRDYVYDDTGALRIDSINLRRNNSAPWTAEWKREYAYTANNQQKTIFTWYWGGVTKGWSYPQKVEYEYNANGQMISSTVFLFMEATGNWKMRSVPHTYDYDISGKLVREKYQAMNSDLLMDYLIDYDYPNDSTVWVQTRKKYFRDSLFGISHTEERISAKDGRLLRQTFSRIDPNDGQRHFHSKNTWVYDPEGVVLEAAEFLWMSGTWCLYRRTHYYYPAEISGIKHDSEIRINAYPNPTEGVVWLTGIKDMATVSVCTMNGQVIRRDCRVGTSVDLSGLVPGMYLLVIKAEGFEPVRLRIIRN